mgnify:CR=1 FL=1
MAGPSPNIINTSTVKGRILNLAQTSVYQVKLQPPEEVKSYLNESWTGVNYAVDGFDIELLCTETNLPGQTMATHDQTLDYPGVTEKMAYRKIYDDRIDFTFMVDKEYNVIQFLEGWIDFVAGQGTTFDSDEYVNRTRYYRMNYPNDYKTDALYITKFEKDVKESALTYQFVGAFPLAITATPVSYNASDVLRCSASFSYMRYVKRRQRILQTA